MSKPWIFGLILVGAGAAVYFFTRNSKPSNPTAPNPQTAPTSTVINQAPVDVGTAAVNGAAQVLTAALEG